MKTFIVQATQVVSFASLDYEDQQDINWITEPYEIEVETEDDALDSYHSNIPISCLDDFDIDVTEKTITYLGQPLNDGDEWPKHRDPTGPGYTEE